MNLEKIIALVLAFIVIVVTSAFFFMAYGDEIFKNLNPDEKNPDEKDDNKDNTGNKSYKEISRYSTIQRNETQNITQGLSGDILEVQLLFLRLSDDDFVFSYHPLSDETVYFEVEIVEVQDIESLNITDISYGDYVDLHYIGRYSSNDTIFSTSYDDPVAKTGGTPLKVFVNDNVSAEPADQFVDYINNPLRAFSIEEYIELMKSPLGTKKGFFEELTSAKINPEDPTFTTGDIPPEKAYGITVKMNTLLNLTPLVGEWLEYEIVDIQENQPIPQEIFDLYGDAFGETTTIFTLRENMYYIGKEIVEKYPSWDGSTIVTKINDTKIWMYTSPPDYLGDVFTWSEINQETGEKIDFPQNTSTIDYIDEDIIKIKHTPMIDDTIQESIYYAAYGIYFTNNTYTVESLTNDKINLSYNSQ